MSVDTRNIFQRIHAVQSAVDYVKRENVPKSGTGIFRDHLVEIVRPHILANGIVVTTTQVGNGRFIEPSAGALEKNNNLMIYVGKYATTFYNVDNPSDFHTVECEAQGNDHGDKGLGKAKTYAEKTNLVDMLFLISGVQDEARLPGEGGDTQVTEPAGKAVIAEPKRKSEAAVVDVAPTVTPVTTEEGSAARPSKSLFDAITAANAVESKGAATSGIIKQYQVGAVAKGLLPKVAATLAHAGVNVVSKEVAVAVWKWVCEQPDPVAA